MSPPVISRAYISLRVSLQLPLKFLITIFVIILRSLVNSRQLVFGNNCRSLAETCVKFVTFGLIFIVFQSEILYLKINWPCVTMGRQVILVLLAEQIFDVDESTKYRSHRVLEDKPLEDRKVYRCEKHRTDRRGDVWRRPIHLWTLLAKMLMVSDHIKYKELN